MQIFEPALRIFKGLQLNKWNYHLSIGFLLLNTIIFAYLIFSKYENYINSDSSVAMILSQEIINTKAYFPKDWNYTLEVWIDRHLFFIPAILIFSFGYSAFAIGTIAYAALLFYSVWLITGILQIDKTNRIYIVAILIGGISFSNFQNILADHHYGLFLTYAIFFISAFLLWLQNPVSYKYLIYICSLLILTFAANPSRAALNYLIPSILALLLSGKKLSKENTARFIIAIVIGTMLGILLNKLVLASVYFSPAYADLTWKMFDPASSINLAFNSFNSILGLSKVDGIKILSPEGVYAGMRLLCTIGIISISSIALINMHSYSDFNKKYFILFSWISFFTILLLELNSNLSGNRYLNPAILLLLIIAICYPINKILAPKLFLYRFICTIILAFSGTYLLSIPSSRIYTEMQYSSNKSQKSLINFLNSNNLHHGYGTWWVAHVTTLLSKGNILVRPIHIDQDNPIPIPIKAASVNGWYLPNHNISESFLLLKRDEEKYLNLSMLKSLNLEPTKILHFDDYLILVFKTNIANNMPWDPRFESNIDILPTKSSYTQIGTIKIDATNSKESLVAEKGKTGALFYGPYWEIARGEYKISFSIDSTNTSTQNSYRVDAFCSDKNLNLKEGYGGGKSGTSIDLEIKILEPCKIEFRVWSNGNERVALNSISIARAKGS